MKSVITVADIAAVFVVGLNSKTTTKTALVAPFACWRLFSWLFWSLIRATGLCERECERLDEASDLASSVVLRARRCATRVTAYTASRMRSDFVTLSSTNFTVTRIDVSAPGLPPRVLLAGSLCTGSAGSVPAGQAAPVGQAGCQSARRPYRLSGILTGTTWAGRTGLWRARATGRDIEKRGPSRAT